MQQPETPNIFGLTFIELQSVDSTNNYARSLLNLLLLPERQLLAEGTVVYAHEQLDGKGQRGKTWASQKDCNIAMSLLLKPVQIPVSRQFELSASVAVAVHQFLQKKTGKDFKIKWPNDLYWQDRKAGGILIENVIKSGEGLTGHWDWAIIGIGINVNQTNFDESLPNPVSLKQITGMTFDITELVKELATVIWSHVLQLNTVGFAEIYNQYNSHLYKQGELVKLKKGSRVFEAVIKNVDAQGFLLIEHSVEERIAFGEVEFRI